MKQLLVCGSASPYGDTLAHLIDHSVDTYKGKIGVTYLSSGAETLLASTANPSGDFFSLLLNRGVGNVPFRVDEVDLKSLTVTKTVYNAATQFSASFTFPTAVVGEEYSVIILKKGTHFNERNKFTASVVAKVTTAATVAAALKDAINAFSEQTGLTASVSTATVTLTGSADGQDYEVKLIDSLDGTTLTVSTNGKAAVADSAWVKNLASQCAAGKGFEYTGEDLDIYPGYPEAIGSAGYTIYNLRFAVPRRSGKQRDEVVWQYVHIAVPQSASGTANTSLDKVLGITPASE